jgi:hypothetical protein
MSGIPGPSSTKVIRTPRRIPSVITSISAKPPPPCSSALRASSLAAVTSFVVSSSENPARWDCSRARWRTNTTSSFAAISTRIGGFAGSAIAGVTQELHALLDVERGPHAGQ